MSTKLIPVNEPRIGELEGEYLRQCISSGWISSDGPFVAQFEQEFAALCQRRYGIAVSNGSVALDLAVHSLGLAPGAEVIIPTFTIISCAAAVVRAGLVPVTVDCDPLTWNASADDVAAAITSKTAAIMLVHVYGLPVDLDPIIELAKKNNLLIIEDAAEMHGQRYKGKPCGSFGILSTFSFYANKHITTGEGGMILTDDEALAERLRGLRNLCFQPERRFVHEELGWNARMSNLQAALGLAQVQRLDSTVQKKRKMGAAYNTLLADNNMIRTPVDRTDYAYNNYWVYGVVLSDCFPHSTSEVMHRLNLLGVGTRPFFWCMHEQPVFKKAGHFADVRHPNAERIARRGFYLPSGVALTPDQLQYSASMLKEILCGNI